MKLSRGARRCLAVLKSYLGGKQYCWPSQKTIAREMNCSKRSVIRYIAELREAKIVTSVRSNRNACYIYTLQTDLSPRLSPRIVTSKEAHLLMNLKPSEQGKKPPAMERTQNHRAAIEAPAAYTDRGVFLGRGAASGGGAMSQYAVAAQDRALYDRFAREYPFAAASQFDAYKRECDGVEQRSKTA